MVIYHTEFISGLIAERKITPTKEINQMVTYHDPCYLGRYNGIYEPPRRLLEAIPKIEIVEMKRSRAQSFCCGEGGGHSWMEVKGGRRINQMRLEQASKTHAQVICLACPFCLQMIEDARRGLESTMQSKDVIELLADAL